MSGVNSKYYTRDYYLSDCSGYELYKKFKGKRIEPRLELITKLLGDVNNKKILDIGCGRGEMISWCVSNGASYSVGIDYSINAIKLCKENSSRMRSTYMNRFNFKVMNAKNLEYGNNFFDIVLLSEIYEHLYPDEKLTVLKEAKRVLKKRGIIILHTAPNSVFNDFTYKYWCYPVSNLLILLNRILPLSNKKYGKLVPPSKIRSTSHEIMHVGEPTYFSLYEDLKKVELKGEIYSSNTTILKPVLSWKDSVFNFLVYLYPISRFFPVNIIFGNDFVVSLVKL